MRKDILAFLIPFMIGCGIVLWMLYWLIVHDGKIFAVIVSSAITFIIILMVDMRLLVMKQEGTYPQWIERYLSKIGIVWCALWAFIEIDEVRMYLAGMWLGYFFADTMLELMDLYRKYIK